MPRFAGRALAGLVLLGCGTASPAARADPGDQTVTLQNRFEKQDATATFTVPADWSVKTRRSRATLTAPSSRKDCTHGITVDLGALYVAPTTTSASWVKSRLSDKGQTVAAFPGPMSWGAATVPGSRAADGVAAQLTGAGRYGPIMTEVRLSGSLSPTCAPNQGPKLAKRLARLLPGVRIAATKR